MKEECLAIAHETLRSSWAEGERDGLGYGYSRPSPGHYPWQWYWDSCFHAIVWRRFEGDRAESELRSLVGGMRDDGFVGHTIFWDRPVSIRRAWRYNVDSRRSKMTSTIQPPLLAWAWRIAVGDPRDEPAIARHHDWLTANRDLEGDGLLWIIQPDESGLDASPKFDGVWGPRAHGRLGFARLIARNRRLGWDARAIRDDGNPVICEVTTNVLWGLSRMAMGQPSITGALIDRCWDERRGLFLDHELPRDRRLQVSTWASLAPLALPDLPEEIGRRLIDEHLLEPTRYWLPVAPPSVSADEPKFDPKRWRWPVRRYWRGPTWMNSAWLLWLGMRRLGYTSQAESMASALAEAVMRERLREFYEPHSGKGQGAHEFGWSSLIAEMVDPDPGAARSHLP